MSYDNSNQAILSKVVSDKENAPALRVEFNVEGVKYKASLWPWTRKDGSPVTDKNGNGQYKGKVERDTYGEEQQASGMAQAKAAAEPDFGDIDSIPF